MVIALPKITQSGSDGPEQDNRGAWRATVHGIARVRQDWTTEQQQQSQTLQSTQQGMIFLEWSGRALFKIKYSLNVGEWLAFD